MLKCNVFDQILYPRRASRRRDAGVGVEQEAVLCFGAKRVGGEHKGVFDIGPIVVELV